MKQGKELKLELYNNYNIVYGSINNKASKAIYINITAWADPQVDGDVNYDRVIKDIDKKIRQNLYNKFETDITTSFIKERTIVDLDVRKSGIRYGKRSFTSFEVTLFLKNETPVNSLLIKDTLHDIVELVISSTFEKNKYFKFYKTKLK